MHGPAGIPETRFHFKTRSVEVWPRREHLHRFLCTLRHTTGAAQKASFYNILEEPRSMTRPPSNRPRVSIPPPPKLKDSVLTDFNRHCVRLRSLLRSRPQLFPAERFAARAATPLHVRDRHGRKGALRLPHFRQFTLAVRACHCKGIRFLFTGSIVTLEPKLPPASRPRTFLACCFAFSSVRNRLGSRFEVPASNST
jgi:hypothetical protein